MFERARTMTLMERTGMACLPNWPSWRGAGGDLAGGHGGEAGEDISELLLCNGAIKRWLPSCRNGRKCKYPVAW